MAAMGPDALLARYRALQQETDFALWRAREAAHEVRARYAAHARGEGAPPEAALLEQLAELETVAEARYKELRTFVRTEFERLAQAHEHPASR
jgi:hypothetical protein